MLAGFTQRLGGINDWLYLWVVIGLLVLVGVVMTVRTRAVQFRLFGQMLRYIGHSREGGEGGISSFQAFAIGMATRIGIGNITGVALAVILGGPGAVFWMWLVSLVGMATAFAEATLAQIFKERAGDGTFRGGPAFYIARGTGSRTFGGVFAVLLIFSMVIAMPMVQANAISSVAQGSHGVPAWTMAIVLAALTGVVVMGGVRGVARVAEWLTPLMALVYLVAGIAIVLLNVGSVPGFLGDIFAGAFGVREGLAGVAGGVWATILNGVRRGLFSNEAGMGTNPNAAATATVRHPVQQGLIQSFGVFFDTFFICTMTAFIIFASGAGNYVPGVTTPTAAGTLTTDAVLFSLGGWMAWPMTIIIFFFGFSSILGAYAYAEVNMGFLRAPRWSYWVLRVVVVLTTGIGAVLALTTVWALMDTAMALITVVNLAALLLLGRWVILALRDYETQRASGESPKFDPAQLPRLDLTKISDAWDRPVEEVRVS
ncbi:alanine or glycine:cation symporter, AGCS family [Raineyella antarctica]|uniref:Alanine or glycine:cation symporter, AGCS family n=2 Tax=Raineyella antarctica TaxID=1577474 RepID=A0A1G6GQM9_9ACTN|nr:alanine or glycine:cation symporter, AGCS family [Raineyella antarctica]